MPDPTLQQLNAIDNLAMASANMKVYLHNKARSRRGDTYEPKTQESRERHLTQALVEWQAAQGESHDSSQLI